MCCTTLIRRVSDLKGDAKEKECEDPWEIDEALAKATLTLK